MCIRDSVVVARDGPVAGGGFVYWMAFERDPYGLSFASEGFDALRNEDIRETMKADARGLEGPSTRRAVPRLWRSASPAGQLRVAYDGLPLALVHGAYGGASSLAFSGPPAALTTALATLDVKPARDYFGAIAVDLAVADAAGAAAHFGLRVVVRDANDAPFALSLIHI